jgi:uncharacterized membrane protein YhaH (DUF805 family)
VTFVESVSTCLKKYADFSGRASRSEYWWYFLFFSVVPAGLMIINQTLGTIVFFALLLPQLSSGARRLHDIDKSGWLLLVSLIPFIGTLIIIYWCVLPGSDAPNEYGPPPDTGTT